MGLQIVFRKKVYTTLDELQKDLDDWVNYYYHAERINEKCATVEHQYFLYYSVLNKFLKE